MDIKDLARQHIEDAIRRGYLILTGEAGDEVVRVVSTSTILSLCRAELKDDEDSKDAKVADSAPAEMLSSGPLEHKPYELAKNFIERFEKLQEEQFSTPDFSKEYGSHVLCDVCEAFVLKSMVKLAVKDGKTVLICNSCKQNELTKEWKE